ncbi:MAG: dihydrodipicolinate synthase family protein [Candidatus Hydrogenedentes bacterium]|nr:dihydrodipicolinate synthase family protein [Candidatus Hydrogenedentota bacterium]
MIRLTGLIAATFTPMDEEGNVNQAPVPAMVDYLLAQGVRGLYVCGSTGEGPSLTTEERESVAEAFVRAAAGRLPVVVQVGHNSVEDARRLAAHAAHIGADAFSAKPPTYFKPDSMAVLVETVGHIADAAPGLPFYYYHIPRLSGVVVDVPEFLAAASSRIPRLAGVKFSHFELDMLQRCRALDGGRYNVLFGMDEQLLSGYAAGCEGAVGSTYNFLARLYNDVIRNFEKGNIDAARQGQLKAAGIIRILLRFHGLSGIKAAMTFAGVACGPTRLPLTRLSAAEIDALRHALDVAGFFEYASPHAL